MVKMGSEWVNEHLSIQSCDKLLRAILPLSLAGCQVGTVLDRLETFNLVWTAWDMLHIKDKSLISFRSGGSE